MTRDDLLAALRLHQCAGMGSRNTLMIVGGFAALVVVVIAGVTSPSNDALLAAPVGGAGMIAYLYLLFGLVRYVRIPLAVRRQFKEQRNLQEPHTIAWSDRSYAVRGETVQSDMPWDHFVRWRENDRVLLLYQASKLFQVVPKRSLPPAAIDEIRKHLTNAKVPRGKLFLG